MFLELALTQAHQETSGSLLNTENKLLKYISLCMCRHYSHVLDVMLAVLNKVTLDATCANMQAAGNKSNMICFTPHDFRSNDIITMY